MEYIRADRSIVRFSSKGESSVKHDFYFTEIFGKMEKRSKLLQKLSNAQNIEGSPNEEMQCQSAEASVQLLSTASQSISFNNASGGIPRTDVRDVQNDDEKNPQATMHSELCPFCMAFIEDSDSADSLTQEGVDAIMLAAKNKKDPGFVCRIGQLVHTTCRTHYILLGGHPEITSAETSENDGSNTQFATNDDDETVLLNGIPVAWDKLGTYVTLKALKDIKHGDKSTITKINTPMDTYSMDKKVNDDITASSDYNIYICKKNAEIHSFVQAVFITYLRVDGKPVETTLSQLIEVIGFSS